MATVPLPPHASAPQLWRDDVRAARLAGVVRVGLGLLALLVVGGAVALLTAGFDPRVVLAGAVVLVLLIAVSAVSTVSAQQRRRSPP